MKEIYTKKDIGTKELTKEKTFRRNKKIYTRAKYIYGGYLYKENICNSIFIN